MAAPMSTRMLENGAALTRMCSRIVRRTPVAPRVACGCRFMSSIKDTPTAKVSNLVEMFQAVMAKQKLQKDTTDTMLPRNNPLTMEQDPANHSLRHEGMFYKLPLDLFDRLYKNLSFTQYYYEQVKTFDEAALMIRRPSLEVINYLKNTNFAYPPNKFIFYGSHGSGKTSCLAHVLHYCHSQQWLIIKLAWPANWNNRAKQRSVSSHNSSRIDLPMESEAWLREFRIINGELLDRLQITIKNTYSWTKREQAEAGTSLLELIEFGINRPKFASDCIGALLKEIKQQSTDLGVKILVSIDGVNSFWRETCWKIEGRDELPPDNISLIHNFKKMLKTDWCNAAVVMTVDQNSSHRTERASYMPRYLLKKEGYEHLDPFVPISVEDYSDKEVHSCIDYYMDKQWIQTPEALTDEGRMKMIFLSGKNPLCLERLVASW